MRRLLVVYGTALVSAVLVAFLVPLAFLAGSLAHDRAITGAREEAQGLTLVVTNAGRAQLQAALAALNREERKVTVFLPDGERVGFPAPRSPSVRLAVRGRAFTASTNGGAEVLVPVADSGGVSVIRVFVPANLLEEGVLATRVTLVVVGLALLMLTIGVGEWIATRLSRSVRDLAVVAERVGSGDLEATVRPAGPREVAAVGRVLNSLGSRIARMLDDERELGANLSHRLRTPVTALRLDVESLRDAEDRQRMTEHVEQLVHAVDAAVLAARHPSHRAAAGSCDAGAVVSNRAEFWRVLADETGRPFTADVAAGAWPVAVPADELGAALDALVDNVFTHTPAGTAFSMAVRPGPGATVDVVVADAGPGFPSPEVGERGRSGAGSTGIGLDVARRTAAEAGGELRLERTEQGGARVVLALSRATLSKP